MKQIFNEADIHYQVVVPRFQWKRIFIWIGNDNTTSRGICNHFKG